MNPNSIFGRYLMKKLLFTFLGVLLTALGIIFIFEMIELLRRASYMKDVSFLFLLELGLTKLPESVDMIFPFIMMIAAMMTFWHVSKTNEFVIIRAAGVSIWEFLLPILTATFIIGVINITIFNPIATRMYDKYERLNLKKKNQNQRI